MKIGFTIALLAATAGSASAQNSYQIDPAHTSAKFAVKHMMISEVHGRFDKVSGTATYDPSNPAADKLEANVELDSVNTNQPQRDADLKSPNFFDAAKYPTMTFRSSHFEKRGKQLVIVGELTLHGVTKPLTLTADEVSSEVKDPYGMFRFGAHAVGTLNRKDFGITWNQTLDNGGAVVADQIQIELDAEFARPGAAAK